MADAERAGRADRFGTGGVGAWRGGKDEEVQAGWNKLDSLQHQSRRSARRAGKCKTGLRCGREVLGVGKVGEVSAPAGRRFTENFATVHSWVSRPNSAPCGRLLSMKYDDEGESYPVGAGVEVGAMT